MKVHPLEWSPYRENPLNWIEGRAERPLATLSGLPVVIKRDMGLFRVFIGEQDPVSSDDNLAVCYLLNMNEVGIIVEGGPDA